jgi:hypothetical protein
MPCLLLGGVMLVWNDVDDVPIENESVKERCERAWFVLRHHLSKTDCANNLVRASIKSMYTQRGCLYECDD